MHKRFLALAAAFGLLASCGGSKEEPAVVRLVDSFAEASVVGTSGSTTAPEPTEWRFESASDLWKVGTGVAGLELGENRMVGRATTGVPILHVERTSGHDDPDVLHEIVVRARVSKGSNLSLTFERGEKVDFENVASRADRFPWGFSTPLVAGDEIQTYTISAASSTQTSVPAANIRHVLLRPTDAEGATFEIESVRLVFRKEHLAGIPSGVSWQGLSEVYRETIVTRAPEEARFLTMLPANPVLDLALGTLEDSPVRFRVSVGGSVVLERTLTTPNRWEEVVVDLSPYAGRGEKEAELSLALESEKDGALGFWGAPAVRQRGALPGDRAARVVFILLDTLRSDHLEAYGYGRTTAPAVSRLAERGVLFRDAIAQGSWTKVSAPSILSSTYPTSNGIHEMFHKLPASADTLAEAFRAAGYATWGGTGNGFSGRGNNLHQGLEVLHERGSIQLPDGMSRSKTARSLVDRLLPWLESHRDVPFFVFLHPIDPHSPYEPYRPYDALYGGADAKAKHDEAWKKVEPLVQKRDRNGRLPHREDVKDSGFDPDEFIQIYRDWYDGSIRAADVEIARVLEKLDELGIAEDTLVVFVSDHGEEFFDHDGTFHEDNVYGELVNVPLLLRWPRGIPEGHVVDETVQILDLAPTILELAGISVPERMQGESLAPLLATSGVRWTKRPAISEWKRRKDQREKGGVDAFSIVYDGYKLVWNVEREEGVPEFELYDHRQDPLDRSDIAEDHPEIVERLSKQLSDWQKWALAEALPTDAEATEGLDAEELERLRSLGYVQ
jgi:arylsulfatase A-like enzyme